MIHNDTELTASAFQDAIYCDRGGETAIPTPAKLAWSVVETLGIAMDYHGILRLYYCNIIIYYHIYYLYSLPLPIPEESL